MKKFGAKDQFAYALGDTGGSFVNLYVDAYFMVFCTYVLGISPYFMGTLFLVSRLWDAINDPLIGSLPDRFKIGKSGDRFKPYIKIFMVPLALSGIFCFTNVSGLSSMWRHVWVSFAYIMYGMCYTGTSMPYGSLASVVTSDPVERTKLSRARSVGGMIVGIALALVPQFIWQVNADGTQSPVPSAFLIIAVIFGIGSLAAYTGLLSGTTERVKYEPSKEGYSYKRVLKGAIKNRPLIGAMIATIGSLIAITGSSQFGSYFWKEYYQAPQMVTYITLLSMPIMLLLFPVIPGLVKRFGKKKTILIPSIVGFGVSLILVFIPIANPWVFFALNIVATFGNSIFSMLVWALVTDCLDYQQKITGERADGSVYSLFTFARKLGSTIASTVASYALGWIGYNSALTTQTAEVAGRIRILYTAIPVVTTVLIIIGLGLVYNLKETEEDEMAKSA
ncbi:MFS transporter [Clostridium culturomicium]|uniref:MFS transporter n=1 Tax=Clostridium culturomicium TaxID=1499683 RepID=UPI00058EE22A|nr:glycoside-pentoside-hexuronide (GPH):cation symporter [Clostridium culturomicium]